MNYVHQHKLQSAIVSCSIGQYAEYLAKKFKIDHVFANPLEIKNNQLTGQLDLQVRANQKKEILEKLIKKLQLKKSNIAVFGDSKFDLPMFEHTHHSFIIRNAKYKTQAKYFINDFFEVLKLLKSDRLSQ
jgi:phosphoserine phosphatase